jgi:hypothetical protein
VQAVLKDEVGDEVGGSEILPLGLTWRGLEGVGHAGGLELPEGAIAFDGVHVLWSVGCDRE